MALVINLTTHLYRRYDVFQAKLTTFLFFLSILTLEYILKVQFSDLFSSTFQADTYSYLLTVTPFNWSTFWHITYSFSYFKVSFN